MTPFTYQPSPWVPFRDLDVIERCRRLTREELGRHANPDIKIRILPGEEITFRWFSDLIGRIVRARDEGRRCGPRAGSSSASRARTCRSTER